MQTYVNVNEFSLGSSCIDFVRFLERLIGKVTGCVRLDSLEIDRKQDACANDEECCGRTRQGEESRTEKTPGQQ